MRTLRAHPHMLALAVALMASFVIGFAGTAQAQPSALPEPADEAPPRAELGFRAGVNATSFYGSSVEQTEPDIGFHGGVFFSYRLTPHLAVQPEAIFSIQNGTATQSRVFNKAGTIDYEFGVLDVPVMLKAYLPRYGQTQLYLLGGPFVGFNLYEKAHDMRQALSDIDLDRELRSTHYGAMFGLGFSGDAGPHTVSLDLRYRLGLTDLFAQEDRPDFHNRGFTASLGLSF